MDHIIFSINLILLNLVIVGDGRNYLEPGNISGMCNGSNKYSHVGGYIFKFG